MLEVFENAIVYAMTVYVGLGLLFAVRFVWSGKPLVTSIAPRAASRFALTLCS